MSLEDQMLRQLKDLQEGNPPRADAGLFGASLSSDLAQIALVPVPFEATTSYGGGTSAAPEAILQASHQLDLFDKAWGNPFLSGISMIPSDQEILALSRSGKALAQEVIKSWEKSGHPKEDALAKVNEYSKQVNDIVYKQCKSLLAQGKIVGILGGDHSCPYGLLKALSEQSANFGILHVDAHHDLREAYEGFEHSHASIMHNAMMDFPIKSLLSIGIRDFSEQEYRLATTNKRIRTLYDIDLAQLQTSGESLNKIFTDALSFLPDEIYISFDIDGLEPHLCPHTGTPVPGGLRFQEAMILLELAVSLGKKIIGFDLCEVCPGDDEWDANVGARVLYKLCGAASVSNKLGSLLERL